MPLSDWLQYTSTHLFKMQDGFSELPYLSNSPSLMVEGFAAMPIVRHNKEAQTISTDNSNFIGKQHYFQLQEGLWLLATDFDFRTNVVCKAKYEKSIPADYYFLSFAVMGYHFPVQDKFSSFVNLLSTTCTFYRPGTEVNTFFYEGTHGKVFNIGFTKQWVLNNIIFTNEAEKLAATAFLNCQAGFMNRPQLVPDAERLSHDIWDYITYNSGKAAEEIYISDLLTKVISRFLRSSDTQSAMEDFSRFNNDDYASIAKAEKMILMNLHTPFMGTEAVSKAVHVSQTKLKIMFRSVFGFSMLQYHKEKNMLLALQLIRNSNMQVRNIALASGFESASKFTAAFKKRFGFLPSQKTKTYVVQ